MYVCVSVVNGHQSMNLEDDLQELVHPFCHVVLRTELRLVSRHFYPLSHLACTRVATGLPGGLLLSLGFTASSDWDSILPL